MKSRTAMMNDRRDTAMKDALRQLRDEVEVPPVDPARERALLAAFDAHWARPRQAPPRWAWVATAAMATLTVALGSVVSQRTQRTMPPGPDQSNEPVQFVPWPGAQVLPPLESGELIRVGLPVSALPALGLQPPSSAASVVQAEIVVGQDGFARAVRLVQQ
jgi:hypothetical protein